MAIITAIFGALLGLYINNIFTWKIKDKIEAADACRKNLIIIKETLEIKPFDMSKIITPVHELLISADLLDNKLEPQIQKVFFTKESERGDFKEWILKESSGLLERILEIRKQLTSFRYMMQQLFMNWGTLVAILLAVIAYLLFYCFSLSHLTPVVHIVEMYSN